MATYYWVGGDGTWNNANTANWSNASGGASGFGPPTNLDTAIFDSASGTGTCTTAATAAGNNVTLNSSTLVCKLGADFFIGNTFTLTLGTLDLNNQKLTCGVAFSSNNSNTRAILFGTGNITIPNNAGTLWQCSTITNFSYTGTPTVNLTYAGSTGTRTIQHGITAGGTESNAVSFNVTAGSDIVSFSNSTLSTYKTLDFTGFSGTLSNNYCQIYGNLIVSSGMTLTAGTNQLRFYATSGTQQITTNGKTLDFPVTFGTGTGTATYQFQDNCTVGSTRTITLTNGTLDLNSKTLSTGIFSSTNSNTRSILFGTGNITITGNAASVVLMNILTGFTCTGTPVINSTYSGSTGTRAFRIGNTSGAVESNAISLNISAGSDTVDAAGSFKSVNFTGFSGTLLQQLWTVYGNMTYSSGMTVNAGTNAVTFAGTSGTQQITTNNKTLDFPLTFNGIGGTFAFQDALTQGSTKATTLTNGTLQLKAGVTSTIGSLTTSGTNQKYLQSTLAGSQATLSDASGTNSLSYTTIQDIFATGGATWNAYYANGNIDGGNNTNWNFGGTPSYDAEYGYKLRSFTETGRF